MEGSEFGPRVPARAWRLASSKTARLRPMPKRVRAPPNGHKRGLRLSGKFVVLRYFTHNEPYMKSHQRDPLVFSGLVSFWVKFRKVRFGPDPVTTHETGRRTPDRGSSAGARRHATTAPWGMVHRRRRRYRQTTLLPYSRTAGHLVRPLGTAREARTDLRGKPRPTDRTNAWLKSPAVPHLHSDGQRQAVVARTTRR